MKEGLVSIISPCYNGEKYVKNFLESVLNQTYKKIELIMVNDGSTDNTEKILKTYEERFLERGFLYIYYHQENKGQAAAINIGLKKYTGEYLMWVDSDDILLPQNVEKKVNFLKEHQECGFVICQGEVVKSDNLDRVVGNLYRRTPKGKDYLFSDLIFERNVVFCPGVIMARQSSIEKTIPQNEIFESREGQNWQLMLPLAYSYKCGYIEEVLFRCVAHNDSHSRTERSYVELVKRNDNFIVLLTETIQRLVQMPVEEKQEWISKVFIKHNIKNMQLAYRNGKWQDYRNLKSMLKNYANEHHMEAFYRNYLLKIIVSDIKKICYRVFSLPLKLVKKVSGGYTIVV